MPPSNSSDYHGKFVELFLPKRENVSASALGIELPNLESYQPKPAAPPHFPTHLELVEASLKPPPVDGEERGLFEQILQNRADVLLEDALLERDRYPQETRALLEELYLGKRSVGQLTREEKELLNIATFELLARPEVNHGPEHRRVARTKAPAPTQERTNPYAEPETSAPVGEDGLPAYWWLKESP